MISKEKNSLNWKQLTVGLVVLIIIPIVGYQFHCLVQADQKNENKIESTNKDIEKKLDKKTDNETLKIYMQMIEKQNAERQKTLQMQIDNQKVLINKIGK